MFVNNSRDRYLTDLVEWQLYHSIHAKGENIEDVLRGAEGAGLDEEQNLLDEGDVIAEDDAMVAESEPAAAHFTQVCMHLTGHDCLFHDC
jgi:hypothetical protein